MLQIFIRYGSFRFRSVFAGEKGYSKRLRVICEKHKAPANDMAVAVRSAHSAHAGENVNAVEQLTLSRDGVNPPFITPDIETDRSAQSSVFDLRRLPVVRQTCLCML